MDVVEVRAGRRFRLESLLLVLLGVAGGVAAVMAWPPWLAWGVVVPAGALGALVGLVMLVDPRPVLEFDDSGIRFSGGFRAGRLNGGRYGWSEVEVVEPVRSFGSKIVGLSVASKEHATEWFFVRFSDGKRYRIRDMGGEWSAQKLSQTVELKRSSSRPVPGVSKGPTTSE